MPKRKRPEDDPKEQFKRFVKAARNLGVDERSDVVDKEFKRLARKGQSKEDSKSKS